MTRRLHPARASALAPEDLFARTLLGEAGAGVRETEAVAAALLNRAGADPGIRPGLAAACLQCPCWSADAAARARLLTARPDDPAFALCRRIAARALAGALPDPTAGATHWHRAGEMPDWALGSEPRAVVGERVFYRIPG